MIDSSVADLAANAVVWTVVLITLLAVYNRVRARSALHGLIFAAGAIARVVVGTLLFLISYYEVPILEGFHTGRGFWILATDAELYFNLAAEGSRSGLGVISDTHPSPMYVRAMALWMDLAGVTPASAVPFNVLCYAGIVLLLSKMCPLGPASSLAILAITISPALFVVGTQALKDTFCAFLIVTAVAGVHLWATSLSRSGSRKLVLLIGSGGLICLSNYLFSGIRTYFAVLMLASLVAASVWAVLTSGAVRRRRTAAAHLALLAATTLSTAAGGGPYFDYYTGLARATLWEPKQPIVALDKARAGFVASGGATNFGDQSSPEVNDFRSSPEVNDFRSRPDSVATRLRSLIIGAAAIFVPISALKALSLVDFRGGRGLLFITDVDTILLDLALIFGLYLLVTRRSAVSLTPVTVFVAILGVLTTVAMAYVVTNFGTLFRLRLLAVLPLWLLPAIALSHGPCGPAGNSKTTGSPTLSGLIEMGISGSRRR
jgi:hypothetical protein